MFTFNKSNSLPASNRSSENSFVTSPSALTSKSDAGTYQGSEASSQEETPSPEQRVGSFTGKRHLVLTLRSRSNTATSTASSHTSLSPPSMAGNDTSSHRSLFRGKKGKRLSGSFSPYLQSVDQDEPHLGTKRTSVLRKTKKQTERTESSVPNLKHRISSPFDFQHLTHTNRHHFAALREASENDFVAGFRAVRASQAPRRNLNGINAEDLDSPYGSTEDLETPERRSTSAMELRPRPDMVEHIVDAEQPTSSQEDITRPSLRQSRSVESFSPPGVHPRMHRHTQSANPPPRVAALVPVAATHGSVEDASHEQQLVSAPTRTNRRSGIWDDVALLSPTCSGRLLPSMAEEPDYFGHALTTPDNSAVHPITPPFSPGLEDVAEEPDRFVSPRPAPQPPLKSPKSPISPFHESFSIRQRSSIARSHNRKDSHALPKLFDQNSGITRLMPQMSDTLPSPGLTRKSSIRRSPCARRRSNTWRVIEESWEDDVDYIYDNALEAECDLDWELTCSQSAFERRDRTPEHEGHESLATVSSDSSPVTSLMVEQAPALNPALFGDSFRSSELVPTTGNVPELEPRSAISTSTIDTRVHTSSDFFSNPLGFSRGTLGEADRFSFTPFLLSTQEVKDQVTREEMYEKLLADYEGSDRHFPLLEASQSIASSTRSSHIRASKRGSYDSSLMSSGHGSGSWTAAVRRSASSSGSVPELVHSSRAPRPNFSTVVDHPTEQIASSSGLGGDKEDKDDDTTLPGHASHDRTFFTSDDEQESADSTRATIDVDMKTSLELARQGSTCSTRAQTHHHKYAASDGAAKLLSSSSQNFRNRAASSSSVSQKNRNQYLKLFPTPPKRSAASMPTSPLGSTVN